jgi:hypothetical protein
MFRNYLLLFIDIYNYLLTLAKSGSSTIGTATTTGSSVIDVQHLGADTPHSEVTQVSHSSKKALRKELRQAKKEAAKKAIDNTAAEDEDAKVEKLKKRIRDAFLPIQNSISLRITAGVTP